MTPAGPLRVKGAAPRRPSRLYREKYDLVRQVLREGATRPPQGATLLDVGCGSCEPKPRVEDFVRCAGVDLVQNDAGTVDHVLNVEGGLPFAGRSFGHVVALDLLEHLNGFRAGMGEPARVTRRTLVVVLPNLAHLFTRPGFPFEGRLGARYDLGRGGLGDRHRRVSVLPRTDAHMRRFAAEAGTRLRVQHVSDGTRRELCGRGARAVRISPSLGAWKIVHVLERPEPAAGGPSA
jgi:hypothetical protein